MCCMQVTRASESEIQCLHMFVLLDRCLSQLQPSVNNREIQSFRCTIVQVRDIALSVASPPHTASNAQQTQPACHVDVSVSEDQLHADG